MKAKLIAAAAAVLLLSACAFTSAPAETSAPETTLSETSAASSSSPATTERTADYTTAAPTDTLPPETVPPSSEPADTSESLPPPSETAAPETTERTSQATTAAHTTSNQTTPATSAQTTPPVTTAQTTLPVTTSGATTTQPPTSAETTSSQPSPPTAGDPARIVGPAEDVLTGKASYVAEGKAEIDYSCISKGYVMIRYLGEGTPGLKITILTPNSKTYQYGLPSDGRFGIYPLTEGSGSYRINVYRNISGNTYGKLMSKTFEVSPESEFAPFLHANQFVNYSVAGYVPILAQEITSNKKTQLEKLSAVYDFVVGYLSYDYDKAKTVQSGYVPDIEQIYRLKKGICFDYASMMTAMLRSVGIPARLEIGNVTLSKGTVYHAWISTYIDGMGWLHGVIQFDGTDWTMIDPTFASTSSAKENYIPKTANYTAIYCY